MANHKTSPKFSAEVRERAVRMVLAHVRHRGRNDRWMWVGAIGGILLGSAAGALMSIAMPADTLTAWGWRIPFLIGAVIGGFGLWLRRRLPETPPVPRGPGNERLPRFWSRSRPSGARWSVSRSSAYPMG